jgi:hypothetical protein
MIDFLMPEKTHKGSCRAAASFLACLEMAPWRKAWSEASWQKFLAEGETEAELRAIRRCTYSGRSLGPEEFTRVLEQQTLRRLAPRKGGRPRKPQGDENPQVLPLPV